jgi:protoporphyrinogen oxidase
MTKQKNIAIVGAGLGGMSAAWDLAQAGHTVTIFEAADYVGGLASGFKEDRWEWSVEKFYHHWFESDAHLLGIAEELGLRKDIFYPRPTTVLRYKENWYPFDSIISALLFPGLGWGLNKIRFGLVGLYLRFTSNWQALEKTTVDAWMRKWAGRKVYETMWEPMLIGKFGPFYKDVNMAWMWARIKARTPRLGTYKGGFQKFCDDFAEKLRERGVRIQLESPVENITNNPDGTLALTTGSTPATFDQILVTTSPGLLTKIAPDLPQDYLGGLQSLKHMGAVVAIFSLKHKLSNDGHYWFNIPKNEGFPYLALVEHTNFVSSEHFNNETIIYCGDYLPVDHENFSKSDDEIIEEFTASFKRFNPEFEMDWINQSWVFSSKYAQPVPLLNHSKNIPAIQTPVPGLFFASMSQVYPWDRGTNFAVEIGRDAAKLIME